MLSLSLPNQFLVLRASGYNVTSEWQRMGNQPGTCCHDWLNAFACLLVDGFPDVKHSQCLRNRQKHSRIR
jgi:hypothetical protein